MIMSKNEQAYLDLIRDVRDHGTQKGDRTGTGTISHFGAQMRFDLNDGFPLLTTKKIHTKSVIYELLWFLKGDTHVKYLQDNGVRIWNEWASAEQTARFGKPEGELGAVYGHQWRNFGASQKEDGSYNTDGFDQIAWVVNEIKTNPNSRRLIVSGWNPAEANDVALPPCHTLFQFHVNDGKLSCQLYQRSADTFLGVPFNIASYALLTCMLAQVCGYEPKEFIHTIGDAHIYKDHFDVVKTQIEREPLPLPHLVLNKDIDNLFDFKIEDIKLEGYQSHGPLKGKVSV